MDKAKKLLKISGILKCIVGAFLWEVPYGILLILSGIFLYILSTKEDEKIYRYNFMNIVLGIIGIADLAGSVIQFFNYDIIDRCKKNQINAPPKVVYKMSKEQKKIDYLLKLGVLMVFAAGVLFATTSWEFIIDPLKSVFLCLFGLLFLGLSLFTENKLKLYSSARLYWILSMSFFVLTVVSLLYFEIFGTYISYNGEGYYLAFAITYFTITGFAFISYLKYPNHLYLYLGYTTLFLMITSILSYFDASEISIVCSLSIVTMILNFVNRKSNTLQVFSILLSYILFGFLVIIGNENVVIFIIACLVNLVNLNYLAIMDKKKEVSLLSCLLSYFLILLLVYQVEEIEVWQDVIAGLGVSIYTLLIFSNTIPVAEVIHKVVLLFYTIFMGIIVLASYETVFAIPLAVLAFFILEILYHGWFDVDKNSFISYLEPVVFFYLIYSLVGCISYYGFENEIDFALLYGFSISSILYVILYKLFKDPKMKKIYAVSLMISSSMAIIINTEYMSIIASILVIASSLFIFVDTYIKDNKNINEKIIMVFSYILLLFAVYIPYVFSNILDINAYVAAIIMIALTGLIALVLRDDLVTKVSYSFVIIPLSFIIHLVTSDYVWETILGSVLSLYIVLLSLRYLFKLPFLRNIIYIITLVVILMQMFALDDIYGNIFIGIVGLLTLLFTFKKDQYYPIFITGLIISIVNILHSLRDIWDIIPFWIYLLVGGLFIIGFVTIKEIRKQKEKSSE